MRNRHRCLATCLATVALGVMMPGTLSAALSVPVSPAGEVQSACPTFTWSATDRTSGHEIVVYAVDGDGEVASTPLVSKRLPAGTSAWTPSTESCLQAGGSYAWSVRTVGSTGSPEWSEVALFRISSVPSVDEVERAIRTLRRYLGQREGSETEEDSASSAEATDRKNGTHERGSARWIGHRGAGRHPGEGSRKAFEALQSETITGFSPKAVSPPASYSLSIDGDFDLGGFVFKYGAPFLHTDGGTTYYNTALGLGALTNLDPGYFVPEDGARNTAVGYAALYSNARGANNTASGAFALYSNDYGRFNTAAGAGALVLNFAGDANTAIGHRALLENETGGGNTAVGADALYSNSSGNNNVAVGRYALDSSDGTSNVAIGPDALTSNTTGDRNIAVGRGAGKNNETGSENIWIGSEGANESNTLRIGEGTGTGLLQQDRAFISGIRGAAVTGDTVLVASNDQIGVSSSSRRFKEEIEPLDEVGSRLLELEPVTFRYRPDLVSGGGDPEVGLIAEEVAEIFPELVTRDPEGKPFGVRYDLLSVLLLQELQRQNELHDAHRRHLVALRERLTALEDGQPEPEEKKPWWKRIFTRDRGSP